ncbi:hypothetical protein Fcan01_17574 [Folsomia candida]|uniref:Uncharacterized protein n=1 Tax=Folsomia candida TaxID=158441 RepID=A0A226DQE4_FOLCA|nr:hypothetical protein Fcan01_17574 [Folsomia candida]
MLHLINGTQHRFQSSENSPEVNLVAISTRYTYPCLIFLIDMTSLKFYMHLHTILEGISYNNLDPHFILLQARWPTSYFQAVYRQHSYWLSGAMLLWRIPSGELFRICASCRDAIRFEKFLNGSRNSLRAVPKIEKSVAWIVHTSYPRPPRHETELSCSFRYLGLRTKVTTCVPYVLSTHLNYSLFPRHSRNCALGRVFFAMYAGKSFYETRFLARDEVRMKLFTYATLYTEYNLVIYTGRGGILDFLKMFEPLDAWVWAGLGASLIATFVFVYGMSKARGKLVDVVFTVFSVLLDQSQHDPDTNKESVLPNKVTILAWVRFLSLSRKPPPPR